MKKTCIIFVIILCFSLALSACESNSAKDTPPAQISGTKEPTKDTTQQPSGNSNSADVGAKDPATPADTIAPVLSNGVATRDGAVSATVTFNSDESGAYNYVLTSGSLNEPSLNVKSEFPAHTGVNTISVDLTTNGARDIWIKVKDDANNLSTAIKMTIPMWLPTENTTAVVLSDAAVTDRTETTAVITYNSDAAGRIYFGFAEYVEYEGAVSMDDRGMSMLPGGDSFTVDGLTLDDRTIYIQGKDGAGNESNILKVMIPATTDMTPPVVSVRSTSRVDATLGGIQFKTTELGDLYYVVVAEGAPAPDASSIMSTGVKVDLTEYPDSFSVPLQSADACDVHFIIVDEAGNMSVPAMGKMVSSKPRQ